MYIHHFFNRLFKMKKQLNSLKLCHSLSSFAKQFFNNGCSSIVQLIYIISQFTLTHLFTHKNLRFQVSANGPSRLVPACPPLPTSGLTYIRLHLPVPKVVNCVLIRLYKPRDANSIGLLQIRLLGTHAFGGSVTQGIENDDELHCKHSLGKI